MDKIKVKITEADDWNYEETKEFDSYQAIMEYMKKEYHNWILDWKLPLEEAELKIRKYNGYIE